ncbi:hypothetical protein RSSM_04420 [Rhodopirellula sallentina SM41]|uniref:Uncharacterized protein n=1 Tax=Rhodopirellula sallentina SM41 TaxID=1263870 RepID=M5TY84_9BACT|nr:hypothetical protein RSSM_04420 [Rhodopirellula sallentina SM41]
MLFTPLPIRGFVAYHQLSILTTICRKGITEKTADNHDMHRSRACGRFQMEHQHSRPGDVGRYPTKERDLL